MKVDFKKSLASYQARQGEFQLIEMPVIQYLMIDGRGDPNSSKEYANAIAALFPVAYLLKFASKRSLDRDFVVMPLEALWWASDLDSFTSARDKPSWNWTVMIMVPDWITQEMLDGAIDTVITKSATSGRPVSLAKLRLNTLDEGLCVQTLHIGPYDDEAEILERLHHEFVPGRDLRMRGKHHEIYLSDPRRVEQIKLRTILRQPVESKI